MFQFQSFHFSVIFNFSPLTQTRTAYTGRGGSRIFPVKYRHIPVHRSRTCLAVSYYRCRQTALSCCRSNWMNWS